MEAGTSRCLRLRVALLAYLGDPNPASPLILRAESPMKRAAL